MKKFFTFAFAAFMALAAVAQNPLAVKKAATVKGNVSTKTVTPVKADAKIEKVTNTLSLNSVQSISNQVTQMARNTSVSHSKAKVAPVAASIDAVVGDYKISAKSALQSGLTVNGTKISISKKSATELIIKGIDEEVDLIATYADGILTIPATFLYDNTYYNKKVYWSAWDVENGQYKDNVQATWTGEAFAFDSGEYIGAGMNGLGWFSLDTEMSWVAATGPVQAGIEEILGSYKIKAVSGLQDGSTKNGTVVTFSQGDEANEILIEGWGASGTEPIVATYADGILTIENQTIYSHASYGSLNFGEFDTKTETLKDKTTAEWTGSAFEFNATSYIGAMWITQGAFNFLDRAVSLVKLADGDFTASLTLASRTFAENKGQYTVDLGGDVVAAKFFIVKGDYTATFLNDYALSMGEDIEPGVYDFDLSTQKPGVYSLYLGTLDENESVVNSVVKWVWVQDYSNDDWTSLGKAVYTDDIVCSIYNIEPGEQWGVEVQQNKTNPSQYRLVNLYGPTSYYRNYAYDFDHYVNYNVTEEGVEIEMSPLGVKADESGDWFFASFDGTTGTSRNVVLKDNVITVPADGLLFMFSDYVKSDGEAWDVQNGGGFYANRSGKFKLELPGQLTVNTDVENAKIEISENEISLEKGTTVINIDYVGDATLDVVVTAPGYAPYETKVDFKANGKAVINAIFDTDGINEIGAEAVEVDAPLFNLAGQRVSGNAKGLLIKNGKKYINNK